MCVIPGCEEQVRQSEAAEHQSAGAAQVAGYQGPGSLSVGQLRCHMEFPKAPTALYPVHFNQPATDWTGPAGTAAEFLNPVNIFKGLDK